MGFRFFTFPLASNQMERRRLGVGVTRAPMERLATGSEEAKHGSDAGGG